MGTKLGVLGYINILPVTYALEMGKVKMDGEIRKGVPTNLNLLLSKSELDASFASSIEYAHGDYRLLPYNISCSKDAMSVLLLSRVPIDKIEKIHITKESATAAVLLKILMRYAYKQDVTYGKEGEAELVIGDKALRAFKGHHEYMLDLGRAWNEFSQSKMVFGVLIARRDSSSESIKILLESVEASYEWGKGNMKEIVNYAAQKTGLTKNLIKNYYSCLSYYFNSEDIRGLKKFYEYAKEIGEIRKIPSLEVYKI